MAKKPDRDAIASAVDMIRAVDVHQAAINMTEGLELSAQVQTVVGKWDERGQITGWTKVGKTAAPATVLVEVFVSDIAGADREFNRSARQMQELVDENANLKALYAGAKAALDAFEGAAL